MKRIVLLTIGYLCFTMVGCDHSTRIQSHSLMFKLPAGTAIVEPAANVQARVDRIQASAQELGLHASETYFTYSSTLEEIVSSITEQAELQGLTGGQIAIDAGPATIHEWRFSAAGEDGYIISISLTYFNVEREQIVPGYDEPWAEEWEGFSLSILEGDMRSPQILEPKVE